MRLTSLANLTDMIFHEFNGVVTDHGDYISIETPDNPNYFWGNYLIFSKPPTPQDMPRWRDLFHQRFKNNSRILHETYTWEGLGTADTQLFVENDFVIDATLVLCLEKAEKPKKWNDQIEIRPYESKKDWEEALELQVQIHGKEFPKDHYLVYRRLKNERYQKMIAQNHGIWFGAYLRNQLVGDMGLFWKDKIGRFQLVSTHPDFQRQGICSTLLYNVAQFGLQEKKLNRLVIAADESYFAKEIYKSVGFRVVEKVSGLLLRPKI